MSDCVLHSSVQNQITTERVSIYKHSSQFLLLFSSTPYSMRLKKSCFTTLETESQSSSYSLLQPTKGSSSEPNLSKIKVNIALGTNKYTDCGSKCRQRKGHLYVLCQCRDAGRGKNWGFMPVVKGGHNLPPLVGIGLTDLPNIWGGAMPLRPTPQSGSGITAFNLLEQTCAN